ncbi:glycosyltransferase [Rathayibacter sp. AY1D1]|uniref:glycosyltransferase n=1 Tax=Rathayibacter sp. AY1D1 TaxID=2080542 RepID=UPI0015E27E3F|nr:glycosyltransferase [Rathayibacter sp. AY1D1]
MTTPARRPSRALPANVVLHDPVPVDRHRDNLRDAELVVVTSHDLAYPTGQSVLLEASGCGTCTAVTASAAMTGYIRDGETSFALPLHDPAGIAAVLEAVLSDDGKRAEVARAGRERVLAGLNARRMWAGVRAVLRDAVRERGRA